MDTITWDDEFCCDGDRSLGQGQEFVYEEPVMKQKKGQCESDQFRRLIEERSDKYVI